MRYKKFIIVVLCLSIMGIGFNSSSAQATSLADMQILIQQLQRMIIQLQQQLISITSARKSTSSAPIKLCLSSNLSYGMTSNQVRILQEGLKRDPSVFPPYPGQPAVSTGHFGPKTRAAVIRFQIKYNIRLTGQVDPQTRAKFNELHCYNTTTTTNKKSCQEACKEKGYALGYCHSWPVSKEYWPANMQEEEKACIGVSFPFINIGWTADCKIISPNSKDRGIISPDSRGRELEATCCCTNGAA